MFEEDWGSSAYKGSKDFDQWEVPTANATGFGAAADDYMERGIDLNEQLVKNKPATFFFRMNSEAMNGAGIYKGDVLIVDRSFPSSNGKIIVAIAQGELMVRRILIQGKRVSLQAENPAFGTIQLEANNQQIVWGVVVYNIHKL
jgi:DNA polymerase V